MKFFITGGTGLLGKSLVNKLISRGDDVIVSTRNKEKAKDLLLDKVKIVEADLINSEDWFNYIDGVDCIINLSGEPIIGKKWDKNQKKNIKDSRIKVTENIIKAIEKADQKPQILISGSAVGYYGFQKGDFEITEEHISGNDFLAKLCSNWENESKKADEYSIRTVQLRTGVVLSENGGALEQMSLPFKLYVGGVIGSGDQWIPWIHIDDMINLIIFSIDNQKVKGPINCTAPNAIKMKDFCSLIAKTLNRPNLFSIPNFIIKSVLGESSNIIIHGQNVIPKKATNLGYNFEYKDIESSLKNLLD